MTDHQITPVQSAELERLRAENARLHAALRTLVSYVDAEMNSRLVPIALRDAANNARAALAADIQEAS